MYRDIRQQHIHATSNLPLQILRSTYFPLAALIASSNFSFVRSVHSCAFLCFSSPRILVSATIEGATAWDRNIPVSKISDQPLGISPSHAELDRHVTYIERALVHHEKPIELLADPILRAFLAQAFAASAQDGPVLVQGLGESQPVSFPCHRSPKSNASPDRKRCRSPAR